jgi:hypothetical protein
VVLPQESKCRPPDGEKEVLKEISQVDRDFGFLIGKLPLEDIEAEAAYLHFLNNKKTSVIMRCLNKIDIYLVDPYRFGSVSLIGELHGILLEATK